MNKRGGAHLGARVRVGSVTPLMRRLGPLVVAGLLGLLPLAVPSWSRADDTDAERAAKEIADARDRANAAADAYFSAESQIDSLELDGERLRSDIAVLEARIDALQLQVDNVAINRYTGAGARSVPLLSGFTSPQDQVQIDALIDVINEVSAEDLDEFDSLNRDLEQAQEALRQNTRDAEQRREDLSDLRDAANAEVERLKQVEARRLEDQAVRDALAIEEAERARRAQAEEIAARARAAEEERATRTTEPADGAIVDPDDIDSSVIGRDDIDPTAQGGSGSETGGQTGAGGAGGRPGGLGGIDYGGLEWVCPTAGSAVAFGDTWGAPRSGGRRHQGVDMIGSRGTPILAVVDGFAHPRTNTLGGTTVFLTGADGNKYYYAHLDSYGVLGVVTKGTPIGFMGDTGNARDSVVHLHFEIHPGGGAAVNPYPTVRAHC